MKRYLKRISIILVLSAVSMGMLIFFIPLPPLFADINYSQAVYADNQQLLRLTISQDDKYRLYTPLSQISPILIEATLLQEDQYYRYHPGINPISLFKAAWLTYINGSRRIGASTITMQTARIRYGINSKSLSGKIWQIIRALQLELHYSKNQILEAYLNLAPYGNNIEGVGAASLLFFDKPVKNLNLPEALTLAVIPQNPSKRLPKGSRLKNIRNKLYTRWLANHPGDRHQKNLMGLPLQMRTVHAAPFLAPHFVNEVLSRQKELTLNTTLNLTAQKIIERVTQNYIARKTNFNVNNASVLLIDSRTMSVKALLGSANFFNKKIGGEINGTLAKRSPGSTLKPFIYALALDQGLIHPDTVLKDVPRSFGSYNPENFDNDFVGPIKAKDALVLSRNIPAIYLADQLKQPSLYEFLQQAGIQDLKPELYYGLALVLGGAELSMQELVSLYAMLANDGMYQPLRFLSKQNLPAGKQLLSPEASFLVLDILKEALPLGGNSINQQSFSVAWKTGTSSGYRDAWTIGVFGQYVLAVWIGNFDNSSNSAFIGKEITAPLFFEIVNAIQTQLGPLHDLAKYPERMHLKKISVCKASGLLPTRNCPDTEEVWFIPGKSPIKSDTIHREIAIDNMTGLRACQFDHDVHFAVYEFWSSDLLKIFKRAGIQRRTPPPYDPTCTLGAKADIGLPPQIVSPQMQVNYIASRMIQHSLIPLTSVVDASVNDVYWFIDNTFLGKIKANKTFLWQAKLGKHVVRVVDDFGRSDVRDVNVDSN